MPAILHPVSTQMSALALLFSRRCMDLLVAVPFLHQSRCHGDLHTTSGPRRHIEHLRHGYACTVRQGCWLPRPHHPRPPIYL